MSHAIDHGEAWSSQRQSRSTPARSRDDHGDENAAPLVLVVDDDESTRDAVQTLLELDGYRVEVASDGREAFDALVDGLRPALILLDLNMPRMNGVAFRQAQRRTPGLADIPVIVCSGCTEYERYLSALGSVVFLRKPMTVDCLQTAVHEQCPL